MPDEQQALLVEARRLIRAKRYAEARAILTSLSHPTAQQWLTRLDAIVAPNGAAPFGTPPNGGSALAAGAVPTLPQLKRGVLVCERCGEQEHQGMAHCARPGCPYTFTRAKGDSIPAGIFYVVIALFMVGGGIGVARALLGTPLESMSGGLRFLPAIIGIPAAIFFALVGVALLGQGLFAMFGHWLVLYNPQTGVTSRRGLFLGIELRRRLVLPRQQMTVAVPPLSGGPVSVGLYPAKSGLLRRPEPAEAARVITGTVADLAARGYLAVWEAETRSGLFGRRGTDYVILPGPELRFSRPAGALENHLLTLVTAWPQQLPEADPPRLFGPNVYMLTFLSFERRVFFPARDLLAPTEAEVKRLVTNPRSFEARQARDQAVFWYRQVTDQYPAWARTLEQQVRQALSDRKDSTD